MAQELECVGGPLDGEKRSAFVGERFATGTYDAMPWPMVFPHWAKLGKTKPPVKQDRAWRWRHYDPTLKITKTG